jgi:excinuclease ABC subunit C
MARLSPRLKVRAVFSHFELLREQARALPQTPGIYFWKDERQRTLYIGKAVNLRSRVLSYFSAARHSGRTRELLSIATTITCEVTETELEALFRESALIKREQPFYNRQLRSSRRLFYIKLNLERVDPYLEITRDAREDGSLYFGPFPNAPLARETMAFVHDVLPLRKCAAARPRCRPCIYYQMRKCAAPLIDEDHRRRHEEAIDRLFDILDGRSDRVVAWLERKRDRLSESLLFEQAAEVQQRLDILRDSERAYAILRAAMQCRCVLVLDSPPDDTPRLLLIAHGHVLSVRDAAHPQAEHVAAWVRVHEPVIKSVEFEQSELDAATVLQRWLRCHHERVRWVAIPYQPAAEDLLERVRFVLGAGSREPAPV